ncbi:MAG: tRNA uridine-5-carboxymethylaminomethyl(34) synthesis GTPase MnmE [Desulfobacteraceae bacterium]|nr:tRNA uridine-5-carboxymethylaminomethyl(34) synthesis GTPase MnmE [Desulfobacteraceae bacterium]
MDFRLLQDTICAIATPVGEAGIGLIRTSGPGSLELARKIFKPRRPDLRLKSHTLHYGWIKDPVSGQLIDEVLLSFMAAPSTYTREDTVEINCHSGYAVLDRIVQLILANGVRLAEPGEFTRRAFLNGRIDLSQAEAVVEIIRSRSEQGLLLANRHLRGELRQVIETWRETLLQAQTTIEAYIDFTDDLSEEGEEEGPAYETLVSGLSDSVFTPLLSVLNSYDEGRVLREGLTIVLVGKPNTGKSSMLNALLGKDRAIVAAAPGTTRDVIEDSFLLSGVQVRILDTAGIRNRPDEIESFGIERTLRSVSEADVVLWLIDNSRQLTSEDMKVYEAVRDSRYLVLLNKSDLPSAFPIEKVQERFKGPAPIFRLSVKKQSDIDRLKTYMAETFIRRPLENCRSAIVPNLRQKVLLESARDALLRAFDLLRSGAYGELISFELESARTQFDAVLGWENDSDLLDRIFSQFCIGK